MCNLLLVLDNWITGQFRDLVYSECVMCITINCYTITGMHTHRVPEIGLKYTQRKRHCDHSAGEKGANIAQPSATIEEKKTVYMVANPVKSLQRIMRRRVLFFSACTKPVLCDTGCISSVE